MSIEESKATGEVIKLTISPEVRAYMIAANEMGKQAAAMEAHLQPVNHQYIVLGRDANDNPVYQVSDFFPSSRNATAPKALLDWTEANGITVETILERQGDGTSFVAVYAPSQDHYQTPVGWTHIEGGVEDNQ